MSAPHSQSCACGRPLPEPSGQSRSMSALESVANIAVGMLVAVATQVVAFPLFGIEASARTHAALTVIFTVVSFIRSYGMRRLFNRRR